MISNLMQYNKIIQNQSTTNHAIHITPLNGCLSYLTLIFQANSDIIYEIELIFFFIYHPQLNFI